jgi:hypothetical protein
MVSRFGLVALVSEILLGGILAGKASSQVLPSPDDVGWGPLRQRIQCSQSFEIPTSEKEIEDSIAVFTNTFLHQGYYALTPVAHIDSTVKMGLETRFGFENPDRQYGTLFLSAKRQDPQSKSDYVNTNLGPTSIYIASGGDLDVWIDVSYLTRYISDGAIVPTSQTNLQTSNFFYLLDVVDKQVVRSGSEALGTTQTLFKGILAALDIGISGPDIERKERQIGLRYGGRLAIRKFNIAPVPAWMDYRDIKSIRVDVYWRGSPEGSRPDLLFVDSGINLTTPWKTHNWYPVQVTGRINIPPRQ